MIRFIIGLMLVIAGTAAIDTPAELIMQGHDSSNWMLFTILTAIGLPCMMWGVLGMNRKGF